ncbi:hypothetical protein G3O08_17615 [Cryomorpha ignava]|uniref:Uncharacterized protein n=1 Tax=Cryomorpha ignava TaxID=101383 RepID=A0A7K3WUV7_9FLAO|nr:hypothetical protein [Cryomorpha ignava]NEN25318.1 hypothetical protein [Cryomorpha ignava]
MLFPVGNESSKMPPTPWQTTNLCCYKHATLTASVVNNPISFSINIRSFKGWAAMELRSAAAAQILDQAEGMMLRSGFRFAGALAQRSGDRYFIFLSIEVFIA